MNARSLTVTCPPSNAPLAMITWSPTCAIVRHVAVRHEKIVRADDRFAFRRGGAMHRDVFAENIVVADAQPRRLALRISNPAARRR